MRVGVAGVGRIGRGHAERLMRNSDVSEVLITDSDMSRAGEIGHELGVRIVPTVDGLLAAVDAIVIAASTTAHAELLIAAIQARTPAFCEKPISHDLAISREVAQLADARKVPIQMGFQRRFDPGYRAAATLVKAGGLGTLYAIRTAGHDPQPPWEAYIAHSGGLFRDFGVHDFDALRFVTGQEIVEVYACGAVRQFPIFRKYDDVDTAVATLTLSDGPLALMSLTRHNPRGYDIRMELIGSRDNVAVGWDACTPLRSLEPGAATQADVSHPKDFSVRFRDAYAAELTAFLDVARGRKESPCTVDDAIEALRVAEACERSRRRHRPVALSEIE